MLTLHIIVESCFLSSKTCLLTTCLYIRATFHYYSNRVLNLLRSRAFYPIECITLRNEPFDNKVASSSTHLLLGSTPTTPELQTSSIHRKILVISGKGSGDGGRGSVICTAGAQEESVCNGLNAVRKRRDELLPTEPILLSIHSLPPFLFLFETFFVSHVVIVSWSNQQVQPQGRGTSFPYEICSSKGSTRKGPLRRPATENK